MKYPAKSSQALPLVDAHIMYKPCFLSKAEADDYFQYFLAAVPWQQDYIRIFGKTHPQPRLTALYGNNGKPYAYSGIQMQPHAFSDMLLQLKYKLESELGTSFTSCLLNLYRDGRDSNGWHADNETALGSNPTIASLSLGQERYFHLKHRSRKELKHKMMLEHGSLLMMQGATQEHWLHSIPKTTRKIGPRINLTFRTIL